MDGRVGRRDGSGGSGRVVVAPAREEDLDDVWGLYGRIAREMEGTDHDVWWRLDFHPTRERLEEAASAGELLTARGVGGTLVGALVLDGRQGADYGRVPWTVPCGPDEVSVVHLLGVDPTARGMGVARALVEAAAAEARRRGSRAVRLDAFDNNVAAVGLYRSCGFVDLGVLDIRVGGGLVHASHLMELPLA